MPGTMAARITLLAVVLVAIAGCGAPVTQPVDTVHPTASEPTTDRTSSPTVSHPSNNSVDNSSMISVKGGQLAADPDRIFRRVTQRLAVNVRPPEEITIVTPDETQSTPYLPPFLKVLGVQATTVGSGLSAQTIGADWIRVNRSVASQPRIEGLLAHEYVHVVQVRREVRGRMDDTGVWDTVPESGVEQQLVEEAVVEGTATYTADRYQRTYTDTLPQGIRYGRMYQERETAGGRYFMAPYWFGYRYVAHRLNGTETVESIYARPPRTTEAILHGYDPGEEPPANLSVTVNAEQWQPDDRGRIGELGTRIALSAQLNHSQAVAGADGWGNDVLVPFEDDSQRGYVWITRWDDRANETEFRAALSAALDQRATPTDRGWRDNGTTFRVRRGDDHTTVMLAGPQEFVRNATVKIGRHVIVRGP